MAANPRGAAEGLAWEHRVPVLTNPFLWYDLTKVFVITYLVCVTLMTVVFLIAGEPASVAPIARIFAFVCGGLLAASMPLAALWYWNRVHVRYELSARGVRHQALERKDKVANRLLVVLGLLSGRPSAAGTGLLAASRETEFTRWTDVTRVREHASLGVLSLMSGWRVVQRLHCPPEDFRRIANYVRDHAGRRGDRPA